MTHRSTSLREEFRRRLEPHGPGLVLFARRLLGVGGEAEDAVQAALVRSWERYRAGEEVAAFRAWILRYLVHECRNLQRRRGRRAGGAAELDARPEPMAPFEDVAEALERELAHEAFPDDPRALRECIDQRLLGALDSLAPPERTAFLLRALLDLEYREIAGVCDVPVGTVMSRIFRAREKLRARLAANVGRAPRGGGSRP